ncbi:MAG TPA: oligopeptide/dipeptide ABC transporter ATP-binding protein [Phycisphaerae bacterium]|nr:oligopeptide/dipeptide ABC transporter ATP-binding protein [Phycisphaerae bacterium]
MTATAADTTDADVLLEVRDLKTHFPVRRGLFGRTVGHVRAVDGVSFTLRRGRTLGLVGESGCGKTTAGRTILRLIPATAGAVRFAGADLFALPPAPLRRLRRHMQIIFQDPYGSLNPRMTVGGIIGEPLRVHGLARGRDLERRVADLLDRVGLDPASRNRYPHEFSGGQRQRIGIARAIALAPRFIVCDEPVSALDVSIQSQILNLLERLQADLGLAYLFIAHDLAVVSHISDDVAVMYLGKIVEQAPSRRLYAEPLHPYTKCLLSAIPRWQPAARRDRIVPRGEVPSAFRPPPGCPFHPRCPGAFNRCPVEMPRLLPVDGDPDHLVSCHLYHKESV